MKQYLLRILKGQQKDPLSKGIILILFPFSWIYGIGVFCHRNIFRLLGAYKAPKPVISIGNITVGGAGKTPLVIYLARHLQTNGFKSVILTRGYMPDQSKDSDEVDMLNEQIPFTPVLAGGDRLLNIQKAMRTLPVDVFIADDAFQHWPLRRDLNIVAVDAGNPFGNGLLLPAGILREPISALKRAQIIVLTKIDASFDVESLKLRINKINPKALIVESRYKSIGVVDIFNPGSVHDDFLNGINVVGFCGIGDPQSFESSLNNTGAKVAHLFTFMDHHYYTKKEVQELLQFCRLKECQVLVTTHKDAVKLRVFKDLFTDIKLVYIPIQLEIVKGSDEFIQKVTAIFHY